MTEALARLAPGTQDWNFLPGGLSELDDIELAAVLAGLPRGHYLLARMTWIGDEDEQTIRELAYIATEQASNYFTKDQVLRPGLIRDLTAIALSQTVSTPKCLSCEGRGITEIRKGLPGDCVPCGGTGNGVRGGESTRDAMKLEPHEWKKVSASYGRIETMLLSWQSEAASHAWSKLQAV